jgi:hypothetical protein
MKERGATTSKPSSLLRNLKGILDTRPTCYLIGQFGVRGPLFAVRCSQSPDSRFPGDKYVGYDTCTIVVTGKKLLVAVVNLPVPTQVILAILHPCHNFWDLIHRFQFPKQHHSCDGTERRLLLNYSKHNQKSNNDEAL